MALPKILKIKNSHSTKQPFEADLCKSPGLLSFLFLLTFVFGYLFLDPPGGMSDVKKVLHTLSSLCVKNRRERARIANRGRRFLTSEIFTLDDPEKSQMGKCLIGMF